MTAEEGLEFAHCSDQTAAVNTNFESIFIELGPLPGRCISLCLALRTLIKDCNLFNYQLEHQSGDQGRFQGDAWATLVGIRYLTGLYLTPLVHLQSNIRQIYSLLGSQTVPVIGT